MPATIPVHQAAPVAAVLAATVLVTTVLVAVVLVGKVLVDSVAVKITMTKVIEILQRHKLFLLRELLRVFFSVKADFTCNLQTKVEFKQVSKL